MSTEPTREQTRLKICGRGVADAREKPVVDLRGPDHFCRAHTLEQGLTFHARTAPPTAAAARGCPRASVVFSSLCDAGPVRLQFPAESMHVLWTPRLALCHRCQHVHGPRYACVFARRSPSADISPPPLSIRHVLWSPCQSSHCRRFVARVHPCHARHCGTTLLPFVRLRMRV